VVEQQQMHQEMESAPFLHWKFKLNEKTGQNEFDTITLSDDSVLTEKKIKTAVKNATGSSNLAIGDKILNKVARGMTMEEHSSRLNEASALLPALRPQDETEALLLGQFLALQDSGMKCLRLANLPEQGFYHVERLFLLANKLLNTANQTMQTVLKYRSGGQQTVQVVHVHNEGQAIIAQNLSPTPSNGGLMEKNEN
jgi:hypothetical protein